MIKGNIVRKIKLILLIYTLFNSQLFAETNSTTYLDINDSLELDILSKVEIKKNIKKINIPPRKSLLEVEAEARAIIAEEVAKVEIVKANALAVIARAVASVEIAKIREEQQKESQSDLF
jgi:hypothetical protein